MSRRAAIVEDFDDDTDLPLPNIPLPNTGSGPLLQELDYDEPPRAGPASPPIPLNQVHDVTPYKTWTCIYPIYIDAKRPYGTGQRRVARPKSVWWPLSKDIADATNRLGLGTLHEVQKSHPRDWENPGRVRVLWKKDGRLVNQSIRTKKQLLEAICFQIQLLKPENAPKPPYTTAASASSTAVSVPGSTSSTPAATSAKGKQPATPSKSKSVATKPPSNAPAGGGRRLPIPPDPQPPLSNRVSIYSPALSSGVLIETVKAGMTAQEANAAPVPGAPGGVPAGAQKGKRKVVRVRG